MPLTLRPQSTAAGTVTRAPLPRLASALTSALYAGAVFVVMATAPEVALAASGAGGGAEAASAAVVNTAARGPLSRVAAAGPDARGAVPARALLPAQGAGPSTNPPVPTHDETREHWRHHGVG